MDRLARHNLYPSDLTVDRVTRGGRRLSYKLSVLQQPERARACGSGAKSSADRRPVDPPPIVELQIFEGEGDDLKDITFQMNASYFLFTTLQPARTIAPMRGQPQPQDKTCVLTGTPVAGMVYLDRPQQAGYFIFPDLSVRHEGTYRLSFNLYEELKDVKDLDRKAEDLDSDVGLGSGPHVSHRMEIFSQAFNVFSAKKFPGLSNSTPLSRIVAEQGCRVRIRRETRVRKRKEDGTGYDGDDDRQAGEYADGYGPSAIAHRPRSDSAGSHHSPTSMPLGQDSKRVSQHEMPLYSQSFVPAPEMQHQQQQQQHHHLHQHHQSDPYAQPSYGTAPDSHYSSGYQPMHYPATQSQMPPPPPQMQHSGYGQQPMASHSHQQHYYVPAGAQHQSSYLPAPPPYDNYRHHSYENHASQHHEQQQRTQPAPPYTHSQPTISTGLEQYAGGSRLGGEPVRQLAPRIASSIPSSMTQSMRLPPIQTNLPPTGLLEPSPISAVSTGHYSNHNTDSSSRHASIYGSSSISSMAGSIPKRTHSDAFVQNHQSEPLYDGQRPSLAMHGQEPTNHGPTHLSYRRADGTEQYRAYDQVLRR